MRILTAKLAAIGALLLLQACATYSPYYDSYTSAPTSSVYGYSSSEYAYGSPVSRHSYVGSYRAGSPYIYNEYYSYPRETHSRHYNNNTRVIRNRSIQHHGKHYRKHRRNHYRDKQIARRHHPRHAVSPKIKYKHRDTDKHIRHGHVRPGKRAHTRRSFNPRRNEGQNVRNKPRHRQYNARNRTNHRNHKQQTENRHGQPNRSRAGSSGKRMNKAGQSARNHRRQTQQSSRRLSSSQANRHGIRHKGEIKRRAKRSRRRNTRQNSIVHR